MSPRRLLALVLLLLLTLIIAPKAAAVEVVTAGDIATSGTGDSQTSDRVLAIEPDLVLTLGDHSYPNGTLDEFNNYYDPTWGRFKAITQPSPGNHEWRTQGASGYEAYFGVQAAEIRSFVVGDWRVISMDSSVNIGEQNLGLARALESDRHRCELLYFHHPRWSSGEHGGDPRVSPWWMTAYAHGVDVIINGHAHNYERFHRKTPWGTYSVGGIREFVVGMGGAPTRPFGPVVVAGSQRRITGDANWGVLRLDLSATYYSWEYIDADTGIVLDLGSTVCHK